MVEVPGEDPDAHRADRVSVPAGVGGHVVRAPEAPTVMSFPAMARTTR
jgi:hypothetical protein